MEKINTDIFKNSEELADYLCWKLLAQLLNPAEALQEFLDRYRMLVNSYIKFMNLDERSAFDLRQNAMLSLEEMSDYLNNRANKFAQLMSERDLEESIFGEE